MALLARDFPAQLVHLVTDQPDLHIGLCLIKDRRKPFVDVIEAPPAGDIEDHEGANCSAVVAALESIYFMVSARYCSCPDVSQICALTTLLSISTSLEVYSRAMVGMMLVGTLSLLKL